MSFPRRRESSPFRKAETNIANGNGAAYAAILDSRLRGNDTSVVWRLRLAVAVFRRLPQAA
ncbi:MAG: hypothetical protein ACR2P5_00245 [Gammaproteobacteria bacterium]